MTTETLDAIFDQHNIHPDSRAEFHDLVMDGKTPSTELKTRLKVVDNYRECLEEIFKRLNEPFARFFRPRNPNPAELPDVAAH